MKTDPFNDDELRLPGASGRRDFLRQLAWAAAGVVVGGGIRLGAEAGGRDEEVALKIGVVGGGRMGSALGKLWVKAGHSVLFTSRTPAKLAEMVYDLGPRATAGVPSDAAELCEVIFLALPYTAIPEVARAMAPQLRGKLILDASNPTLRQKVALLEQEGIAGVAKATARAFPDAHYVRGFNAVDASAVTESAAGKTRRLGVPLAGESGPALEIAKRRVWAPGCEPVVTGDLLTSEPFEVGGEAYRINVGAAQLRQVLAEAT